jgi:hypothetical protein
MYLSTAPQTADLLLPSFSELVPNFGITHNRFTGWAGILRLMSRIKLTKQPVSMTASHTTTGEKQTP